MIITIKSLSDSTNQLRIANQEWMTAARQLTPAGFILYLYLVSKTNETKIEFDSTDIVNNEQLMSRRSYYRAIEDLKQCGYIDGNNFYTVSHKETQNNTDKTYTIYRLLFPDGKSYIGATSKNPQTRWNDGDGYRGQTVYTAIQNWGWDAIEKQILATTKDKKQCCKIEQHYIDYYDSIENGYNSIKASIIPEKI